MNKFAQGTKVSAGTTMLQIQELLFSRGVDKLATFNANNVFSFVFEYEGAAFRISMVGPDPSDKRITHKAVNGSTTRARSEQEKSKAYTEELDRRWRALYAIIKAKIVAVEEGITTLEREFLSYALLPSGETIGETYASQLQGISSLDIPRVPALTDGRQS